MSRSIVHTPDWYLCVLIYNFCAFAMQMPIGIVADILNRNALIAGAGCVLAALAYGVAGVPLASAVVAGIGNGMFHIGGGIDILNISREKSGALGVFVSPGALGIYLGTILGRGEALPILPVILVLSGAAGLILVTRRVYGEMYAANAAFSPEIFYGTSNYTSQCTSIRASNKGSQGIMAGNPPGNPPGNPRRAARGALIAVICLFAVVCLRSYIGLGLNFPWKGAGNWGIALVFAAVFGKTGGGFISDGFGAMKTAGVALGAAAVLLLFPGVPVAGVVAVLLINISMPVTLWYMAGAFPGAKGFSFGLLTFGLFLGFLPVYFGAASPPWLFPATAAVSFALLVFALKKIESYRHRVYPQPGRRPPPLSDVSGMETE